MLIDNTKASRFLFVLGILSATWISSPVVGALSLSFFFFINVLLCFFLIAVSKFKIKMNISNAILILLLLVNFFFFILGLIYYNERKYNNLYLLEYYLKETMLILFALFFYRFFYKEKNIKYFFAGLILTLIPLMIILFIYYKIYLSSEFIGAKIDFVYGATREGKNTIGHALTLILPFLFIFFCKIKILKYKKIYLSIFFIFYLYFVYNIDSTASTIITISLILFFFILLLYRLKKKIFLLSFLFLILFLIANEEFFINKFYFIYNYYESIKSVRLSLIKEALSYSVDDNFLGYGTGSFKIRGNNISLETHNVYLLYLFEKGIVGLILNISFYIYILLNLLKKKFKIISYETASILNIFSTLFFFVFINIEVSPLLWTLNCVNLGVLYKKE